MQRYVLLSTDITQIKVYQGHLEHCAHYDVLTNLPNRILLADGFKEINKNHGHRVGNDLLIEVSQRIEAILRESDTLSRIGGDEFIAVMVDLENIDDSLPVLERRLKQLRADQIG